MKRFGFLALALVASACADNPKEQLWILTLATPEAQPELTQEVTHNFTSGTLPDGTVDLDWVVTDTLVTSGSIVTAQFVELEGDDGHDGFLVLAERVYLGVENDDGSWTFGWDNFDNVVSTETHESGYQFESAVQGTSSTQITWSVDKKTRVASGTVSSSVDSSLTWSESDVFDLIDYDTYTYSYGNIPAWMYLVDADGISIFNGGAESDCTADPCTLTYSESQAQDIGFTAVQTDYVDEDVYGALDDAGQPFGS
jgi:hypothetical protein